jgi:hypothetical protein
VYTRPGRCRRSAPSSPFIVCPFIKQNGPPVSCGSVPTPCSLPLRLAGSSGWRTRCHVGPPGWNAARRTLDRLRSPLRHDEGDRPAKFRRMHTGCRGEPLPHRRTKTTVQFTTVLFDLDGTLVDSFELIAEAFRHAIRAVRNREATDDEVFSRWGEPLNGGRHGGRRLTPRALWRSSTRAREQVQVPQSHTR